MVPMYTATSFSLSEQIQTQEETEEDADDQLLDIGEETQGIGPPRKNKR